MFGQGAGGRGHIGWKAEVGRFAEKNEHRTRERPTSNDEWKRERNRNSHSWFDIQFSVFNSQLQSGENMSDEFEPNIIAFCCDY
jgi:hypothetical protein